MPISKPPKAPEVLPKKPIVSKVKGLTEIAEITPIVEKKPEPSQNSEAAELMEKALNEEFKKDFKKPPKKKRTPRANNENAVKPQAKTPVRRKKTPKPQPPAREKEETIQLVSPKTLERKSKPVIQEIDLSNNIFKDCKLEKNSFNAEIPSKIIGCRKRNNVIQYVVLLKNQRLCLPCIVSHQELLKSNPSLLVDFLIESL